MRSNLVFRSFVSGFANMGLWEGERKMLCGQDGRGFLILREGLENVDFDLLVVASWFFKHGIRG